MTDATDRTSVPHHVAEAVLREHGADIRAAERGRGWTNATWLGEDLVVRVAREPGPAGLLREERLVRLLPPEVGCPPVVRSGVRAGHEWVLTRRVPGRSLEEVWPSLDAPARARAIEQMWERARHVHRVDVTAAAPHVRPRSPFFAGSPARATAALDRLVTAGALTRAHARGLERVLDRFWTALPKAPKVLDHGDLCPPNTLWHEGRVVALLDFEFAVVAPLAIDLNELIKLAFAPGDPEDPADRDGRATGDGRDSREDRDALLQDTVRRIAVPSLDEAGGPDVLLGHAVMLETWVLENDLASTDPDENDRATATALLTAFAEGDGGLYAPLLTGIT
ncbi:phosphotransferase family protein [Streptomyces sp. NPDC059477]|uniref:phosphotransferase family protein n=1 Tax=Streptomyces sp. NPDC059477 TaxID=3346847 RepID=UPI0036CE28B4